MVDPKIFNPLFHLFNYAIVIIKNFPGNTIEEIKSGVVTICDRLEIQPEKINVNLWHNIAFVVTEVENAVKLLEYIKKNKKYQFSILDALVEPFSEKHLKIPSSIPINIVKHGISNIIRNEVLRINVTGFTLKTKSIVRGTLIKLMKDSTIDSLGIIFGGNDSIADVYVEKKKANKLLNIFEKNHFEGLSLNFYILKAKDIFNPPDWFIDRLEKEARNSYIGEIPIYNPPENSDDEPVLELNTEAFLNNSSDESVVLEVNCPLSLKNISPLSHTEKLTTLDSDYSLGVENRSNNTPIELFTGRIEQVNQSYASMVRG